MTVIEAWIPKPKISDYCETDFYQYATKRYVDLSRDEMFNSFSKWTFNQFYPGLEKNRCEA